MIQNQMSCGTAGRGFFFWADGDRYEGDFIEGKRTGKGVFIHKGGDCYYGDSVEGISHGKGIYIWTDGEREYVGRIRKRE